MPYQPTKDRGSISAGIAFWIFTAIAVIVWLSLDDWFRTNLFMTVHKAVPFVVPFVIIVILFALAAIVPSGAARFVGATVFIAALGVTITYWVQYGYQTKRAYSAAVEIVDEPMPTFAERAAHPVAAAQAKANLGDVLGTLGPVRYVPDGDDETWNALVTRRGVFTGYEVIEEGTVPLMGRATAETCAFDPDASARIGGHFAHSLDRKIAGARPGTFFNSEDVYGYCDGDTPIVVVPLQRLNGFWHITRVPAGVALYDGLTGKLTVKDEVADGEVPGPVFPMTLAAHLRTSTEALGSFSDYWHSRSGYDSTDGDAGDPNSGNTTEYNLRLANGKGGAYVSPLTPKGQSQSITAVAAVSSTSVKAKEWNTLTVHRYGKDDVRRPGSAMAQAIKGDYGDLPEWAAGMDIFEITPVSSGEWVASLGQKQDILYRVRVEASGDSCLEYADGTKIRCGKVTGEGGNGVGVALQPEAGSSRPVTVPKNDDLSALSNDDLAALQQQITEELLTRLSTPSKSETD